MKTQLLFKVSLALPVSSRTRPAPGVIGFDISKYILDS
jgi:hypothetical protein